MREGYGTCSMYVCLSVCLFVCVFQQEYISIDHTPKYQDSHWCFTSQILMSVTWQMVAASTGVLTYLVASAAVVIRVMSYWKMASLAMV